ncbi:hypothetical protein [Bacillus mycoides]|uniref:hypothetical protein n=1 Tax=Bacillus mycoides TaxID=1405 RepID=UPI003D65EF1A
MVHEDIKVSKEILDQGDYKDRLETKENLETEVRKENLETKELQGIWEQQGL